MMHYLDKQTIVKRLRQIEKEENVRILYACESGSRCWGFASEDSDYDIRFVYVRRMEDYLRVFSQRDVIEMPVDDLWDLNGWDLQKALQLLHKSNSALIEWLQSPGRGMQKRNFDSELKSLNDKPSNQASICKAISSPMLNGVF